MGALTRASEKELRQESIESEGWVQPFVSVRRLLILGVSEDLRRTKLGERSQELYRFLFASLGNLPDERLAAIYADHSGYVLGEEIISRGSSDRLLLPSRALFSQALKLDARRLVLAHNHPSGDATPSKADIRTTQTLARQARELGVVLEDHLIVAANKVFSMKAGGML